MKAKKQQQVQPASLAPSMSQIVPIEKIPDLLESIRLGPLKDRTAAYVASALRLSGALSDEKPEAAKTVRAAVERFSKSARLLDMIMAIGGSAGYLAPDDRIAVESIRAAIQADLAPLVHVARDGMIIINTPDGSVHAETHSSFGRRMAGLMARVVPSTEQDKGQRTKYLSQEVDDSINRLIAEAHAHQSAGRLKEAAEFYKKVLKQNRKSFVALSQLGSILNAIGSPEAALPYLQEARLINPNNIHVLIGLGESLSWLKKYDEALEVYNKALQIAPSNIDGLIGLALLNFHMGRDDETDRMFGNIIKTFPNSPAALVQYGQTLQLRKDSRAALYYTQALAINPRDALAHTYLGLLRHEQCKTAEAKEQFELAYRADPHNEIIQCAKAYFLLAEGEYEEAWRLYETAIGKPEWRQTQLIAGKPVWHGEDITGKKLLIIWEQGLGDVLQFIRYAEQCKKRAASVYVLCDQSLQSLLQNCPYIDGVFTTIANWKYDVQISIMSLPHIFATTLDTVPAKVPYLFVPDKLKTKWAEKIAGSNNYRRVGLVWSGSVFKGALRGDLRAARRNMELKQLLPLFERQDIQFVSLQMGDAAKEIDELGLRDRFIDPMPDVKDMQDTAAIIQNLDLVISVDTSVVHLTGGLGKPVWVLSRYDACWRWLKNRPDSPWYPTAKVFGQPTPGDWGSVVTAVCQDLDALIKARVAAHG